MSKAQGSPASSLSAMRQALDGQVISLHTEAWMIMSSSAACMPASSRACRRASAASWHSDSPWLRSITRRSRTPVRWTIHSSEVSRIFSRSWLLSTLSGTAEPMPASRTPQAVMDAVMRLLLPWRRGDR
jgi:hypothetical protein